MNLNSIPRPLVELQPGQTGRIVALGGPSREVRLRLRTLGLRPGAKVKLLGRGLGGPVRIEVEGCCLALGAGVARRILVAPETEDKE